MYFGITVNIFELYCFFGGRGVELTEEAELEVTEETKVLIFIFLLGVTRMDKIKI